MSNFQRSRSKVWWGDSPPNVGSPVAQPLDRSHLHAEHPEDWAPQLPHWIAEGQQPPAADANAASPNEPAVDQWPLRHDSPGSHKSQDSGFSDSDSSPPPSQYHPSPEGKSPSNKSSSSSDSNNNENVTVKHAIDFKDTEKSAKSADAIDTSSESYNIQNMFATPNTRLRSTSVIQTPYDLDKYIQVHGEELLKDSTENIPMKESPKTDIMITLTTPQNDINEIVNVDVTNNESFLSKHNVTSSQNIKVAKVKDLETIKSKDSLEYLQVSEKDKIAVNNQPRIRSPISSVPYEPEPDYNKDGPERKRPSYSRSHSHNQTRKQECDASSFQRNRLNKSLNYEGQRLDQQILDIQDGYHSLGYIDEDISHLKENIPREATPELPPRGLTPRNILDSLQLKTHKKMGPKYKQRQATKAKAAMCSFRIFPVKREKPAVVETHAGGILEGSRVPSLGLPRYSEQDQWVMVGYPEREMLVHNERLIGSESEVNVHAKLYENKEIKPKSAEIIRLTPPSQAQDLSSKKPPVDIKASGDLTHDSKRERLKASAENFNGHLSMACTSTPKMLAPHEYMDDVTATPQIPAKNTRLRRINLLANFIGDSNSPRAAAGYQARIDDEEAPPPPPPVQRWLRELAGACESECTATLQSKALGGEMRAQLAAGTATITGNIKKVQTHGQIVVHQYSDVVRQLESGHPSEEQLCLLVANINEFVLAHSITLSTRPPGETPERWDRIKRSLQSYLQRLVEIGEDIKTELNDSAGDWAVVSAHLASVVRIFEETAKAVLVQQLRTLVSIIEEPPSSTILKSTLTSISHLAALPGDTPASLHASCAGLMSGMRELPFVECGVPRALLTAVIESDRSSVKALALRALATICVTDEAVRQFEEGGGVDIVSDMLSDARAPEPQTREAVTVLAQVTAPGLPRAGAGGMLRAHLHDILASITRIVSHTECCQLLLLCAACLVNLARAAAAEEEGGAAEAGAGEGELLAAAAQHRTVESLLGAVQRRGPDISVFLQEQTAALLSAVARLRGGERHLAGMRAATLALVCFARVSPADLDTQRDAEQRAQGRLLHHTADAIARLCVLPDVASQIVQLEGVPRLVRLVRMQRARQLRPDTDQTLVRCLQALRTLRRHQPHAFSGQQPDVEEMVRPHLLESLVKFSSKKESFV